MAAIDGGSAWVREQLDGIFAARVQVSRLQAVLHVLAFFSLLVFVAPLVEFLQSGTCF